MDLFWIMMSLVVPGTTVIVLTRLAHNKYVAVLLTFIVFAVSIHQGYFFSEWNIFLNALSIVIGYMLVEIYHLDEFEDNNKE